MPRDLAVLFRDRLAADVTVVNARSDQPSSYEFPADIPVQTHRRQSLLAYFRLLWGLRGSRPDVVVSSWAQDNILVALVFLFSSARVVLIEHSAWRFHGFLIRMLRALVYPLAWRVIVLNRRDFQRARRSLRNVQLIPNPVIAPSETEQPREKLVLAIGHLTPLKNFGDAICAMAESRLEDAGWSLAIVGSGEQEQELRALITHLGLKQTHIYRPESDLASWYAKASLLLIPSRFESFSLVLAEAMASGVVPVCYDSDGPSFILERFPTHIVKMGNVADLARRLANFARATDLEPVRRELRASIQQRFSPRAIADQWAALLG